MDAWYPTDLQTALEVRALHAPLALAGGTDLMVELNAGRRDADAVLALRRVSELTDLGPDRIGAGVTWRRLLGTHDTALAQAARTVGSPQIRATGTIGGNLGTASPAGDGLVVLAALDAIVELASRARGTRLVPIAEFLVGVKRTALAPDELITAVHLPPDRPRRSEFAKVGLRGAMTIAIVNACVTRATDGGTTIALGSVAPTVVRARETEEVVRGADGWSDSLAAEVKRSVGREIRPIDDHRADAEYRRHAAGVLVARLLSWVLS